MKFYWFPLRNNLSIHRPHSSLSQQKHCSLSPSAINNTQNSITTKYNIIQGQIHNCRPRVTVGVHFIVSRYNWRWVLILCFHMAEIEGSVCLLVGLASQEAQHRDGLLIDKQGSGRWSMNNFYSIRWKKWNIYIFSPKVHWLKYTRKCPKGTMQSQVKSGSFI